MSWKENNNRLEKQFELSSFNAIVNKLNILTRVCDEQDHHPDFCVHGYKHISFSLCTHDEGYRVTEKDHALSKEIDRIFSAYT